MKHMDMLSWIAALSLWVGAAGASSPDVLQVDWEKLLPPHAASPVNEPPAPVHGYLGESGPAAKQSGSSAVNPDLEGLTLRIPGFIVPLDVDAAGQVVE